MTCSVFAAAASTVFTAGVSSTAGGVRFGGIRASPGFLGFSAKFSSGFIRSQVFSLRSLRIPLGFVTNGQRTSGVAFATAATEKSVHNFTVKDIDGNDVSLNKFKGKILLIINVASKCGLTTSNYTELSHLYEKYKSQDHSSKTKNKKLVRLQKN